MDSNDRERVKEAEKELFQILKRKGVKGSKLLIFVRKPVSEDFMSVEEIVQNLSLSKVLKRQWHIQYFCDKSGDGIKEGFHWIINVGKSKCLCTYK